MPLSVRKALEDYEEEKKIIQQRGWGKITIDSTSRSEIQQQLMKKRDRSPEGQQEKEIKRQYKLYQLDEFEDE